MPAFVQGLRPPGQEQQEMIMGTIYGTAAAALIEQPAEHSGPLAAFKRAWVAYINWRLERAAMGQMSSMSDRELKDIGLIRSEVARVALFATAPARPRRSAPEQTAL